MLVGNNACLHIVNRTGLYFEILSRSSKEVLPRICMVNEVGTVLQRTDVYTVVFDIEGQDPFKKVDYGSPEVSEVNSRGQLKGFERGLDRLSRHESRSRLDGF